MKESVPLYTPLYVLKGNQFDKGGAKSDKLCEEWDVWDHDVSQKLTWSPW